MLAQNRLLCAQFSSPSNGSAAARRQYRCNNCEPHSAWLPSPPCMPSECPSDACLVALKTRGRPNPSYILDAWCSPWLVAHLPLASGAINRWAPDHKSKQLALAIVSVSGP